MHELALIHGLIQIVCASAQKNGIKRVSAVGLVVGEEHGALPEALQFAFACLTPDTPLAGAELKVEVKPLKFRCPVCGLVYRPSGWLFACPECSGGPPEVLQGQELYVDYFEGEEEGIDESNCCSAAFGRQ